MALAAPALAKPPAVPNKVESPTVKVLTGLTVPEFEREMQHFVQAIGVSCGGCHMPKGNFASDENPRKVRARQMIEMTKALNTAILPDPQAGRGRIHPRPRDLLHLPPGRRQAARWLLEGHRALGTGIGLGPWSTPWPAPSLCPGP